MRIFCDVLGGHIFSTFASLAFAIGRTASAVDLFDSWKLYVSTFFVTCSCDGEKEMMSFFFWFEKELMNSPRHIATHQHHSASAQPAQPAQPATKHNNHSNNQQHRHNNNYQQPTINAQTQQEQQYQPQLHQQQQLQ